MRSNVRRNVPQLEHLQVADPGVGNVSLGVADLLNDNIRLCRDGAKLSIGELCTIRARAIAAMGVEVETETWRQCKQIAKKLLLRQLRDGWHDQQIA